MKQLIKMELELTPTEASTLCDILAKGIKYYTNAFYDETETVNPIWLWGIMNNLSTAMYKQNVEEDVFDEERLIKSMHMVCGNCGVKCKEVCAHCPVCCNADAIHATIEGMETE